MDFSSFSSPFPKNPSPKTQERHYIYEACVLALSTCAKTSWEPQATGDYSHHRLPLENIEGQLQGHLYKAEVKIMVMFMQWASTGKWPRFRNAPVFFTRKILENYIEKFTDRPMRPELPTTLPPWDAKDIAIFLEEVVKGWIEFTGRYWLKELAREQHEFQEQYLDSLEEW